MNYKNWSAFIGQTIILQEILKYQNEILDVFSIYHLPDVERGDSAGGIMPFCQIDIIR